MHRRESILSRGRILHQKKWAEYPHPCCIFVWMAPELSLCWSLFSLGKGGTIDCSNLRGVFIWCCFSVKLWLKVDAWVETFFRVLIHHSLSGGPRLLCEVTCLPSPLLRSRPALPVLQHMVEVCSLVLALLTPFSGCYSEQWASVCDGGKLFWTAGLGRHGSKVKSVLFFATLDSWFVLSHVSHVIYLHVSDRPPRWSEAHWYPCLLWVWQLALTFSWEFLPLVQCMV